MKLDRSYVDYLAEHAELQERVGERDEMNAYAAGAGAGSYFPFPPPQRLHVPTLRCSLFLHQPQPRP